MIRKIGLFVVCCFMVAISVTFVGSADYVAAESGLCLRRTPSDNGDVIEVLPIGTEVPEPKSDWVKYKNGFLSAEWVVDENPLKEVGDWRVTAYASTGSACANGEMPEVGKTIAQNTLSFGTKVYTEGVGVRVVQDRGPSSLGSEWCDLYLGDVGSCVSWGDQYRKVYLVDSSELEKGKEG